MSLLAPVQLDYANQRKDTPSSAAANEMYRLRLATDAFSFSCKLKKKKIGTDRTELIELKLNLMKIQLKCCRFLCVHRDGGERFTVPGTTWNKLSAD